MMNFIKSRQDEADKILENIYDLIREKASIGLNEARFETKDVGLSYGFERYVLDVLIENGFKISYCMSTYTVKW